MIKIGDKVKVVSNKETNFSNYEIGDTFVVKLISNRFMGSKWIFDTPEDYGNGIAIENVELVNTKAQVGDTVISLTDKLDLTKGKEYEVIERDSDEDCVIIRDDVGERYFLYDNIEYKLKNDMKEFTVEVKDKALSKALQEVAFENGWGWFGFGTNKKINDYIGKICFNINDRDICTDSYNNTSIDYTLPQDWNEVVAILSKPQFKKGDWLVDDRENDYWLFKFKEIRNENEYWGTDFYHVRKNNNEKTYVDLNEGWIGIDGKLRHATEEEIKEVQTKKFFKWEVEQSKDYYKIGCRKVEKSYLQDVVSDLKRLDNSKTINELITELTNLLD